MFNTQDRRRQSLALAYERQDEPELARRVRECCRWGRGYFCPTANPLCDPERAAVPKYCRNRSCPVCAPLEAVRMRRELERRIRYVDRKKRRQDHRWSMTTPTLKTHPAILRRKDAHKFIQQATDRMRKLLAEYTAGGALVMELGKNHHLHGHSIVYADYMPAKGPGSGEVGARWRKISRYQVCGQCGAWSWRKSEQTCPTAECPLHGKPMEPIESFIVHVREIKGGVREVVQYVTKYAAKPAQSELADDLALVGRIFRSMKRVRTWGLLYGIAEEDLEAAGCGREKPEPLCCNRCGTHMVRSEIWCSPSRRERERQRDPLTFGELIRLAWPWVGDYRRRKAVHSSGREPPSWGRPAATSSIGNV